jgi:hypothetical protein
MLTFRLRLAGQGLLQAAHSCHMMAFDTLRFFPRTDGVIDINVCPPPENISTVLITGTKSEFISWHLQILSTMPFYDILSRDVKYCHEFIMVLLFLVNWTTRKEQDSANKYIHDRVEAPYNVTEFDFKNI